MLALSLAASSLCKQPTIGAVVTQIRTSSRVHHVMLSLFSVARRPRLQFSIATRVSSRTRLSTLAVSKSHIPDVADFDNEHDPEAELLSRGPISARHVATNHSTRTAPVFTSEALDVLGPAVIPQRAVYGSVLSSHCQSFSVANQSTRPNKIYVNTNAPFSAVVCGLQVCTSVSISLSLRTQ